MDSQPLISIITVVYNGAKTLEQTIQSVLKQTYKNIEYIIIDGGSKDGTLEIIRRNEGSISKWISEPDKGLYDAMNKGIKLANGQLIGMINSDDWFELNAVELIVEAFRKNPEKRIFHGDRIDTLENGKKRLRKFHPSRFKLFYYSMTYNHPTMFVHKDIYISSSYNSNLTVFSDYEFVLTQFLKCKDNFLYIPIGYANYRLDGLSSQINVFGTLKEGYLSRKNAGLSFVENLFAVHICFLACLILIFKKNYKKIINRN
jgi:glycosyltransferase involved in cell wall biosynthesis